MPDLTVEKDDWWTIVETCRDIFRKPDYTAYESLRYYSVCRHGLITRFSSELLKLYNACGGISRLTKPEDYYNLPAIYIDAVKVIERGVIDGDRIRKANAKKNRKN